jgi:acetyl esterase
MNQDLLPEPVRQWRARIRELVTGLPGLMADARTRRPDARTLSDTLAREFTLPGPDCAVSSHQVPGPDGPIEVRHYRSKTASVADRPAQLCLHGGGWIEGSVHDEINDRLARRQAVASGCDVFTPEYRLAPEHPFPAALEDCVAVLRWLAENADALGIDRERIGIAGVSAGGNLAALVAIRARDDGGPYIRQQILEVPAVSLEIEQDGSYHEYAELESAGVAELRGVYLGTADPAVVRLASPMLADDLSGLPATVILTAEFDALRDSGEAYARRLAESGVKVDLVRWSGHVHGSPGLTATYAAAREWQEYVHRAARLGLDSEDAPCR